MASKANLPAITSSLDRDLRTWTDRVRDTLNATGDERLVRYKELIELLDKIKSDITNINKQAAATTASTLYPTAGTGNVTNINNLYSSGLAAEIEKVLRDANNTKLMNHLREGFNDELLKRIAELRKRIDGELLGRIDEIRREYTAKVAYEEGERRAAVYQEYIARQEGDAVLAESLELLNTQVGDNTAAILNEQTARTSADEAMASQLTLLDARVDGNVASILQEQTARATADEALTTRLDFMDSRVDTAEASILTESTTRATADSALSERVDSLTTTVGGYTTSIQTLQSSVDGIEATYSVKIDNNGFVSGYGLTSALAPDGSGAYSNFSVNVNQFTVGTSSADEVAPFTIVGGKTYINEALIKDASISYVKLDGVPYIVEMAADFTASGTYSGVLPITISGLAPGTGAKLIAVLYVQTGDPPAGESGFSVTGFNIGGWGRSYYTHIGHAFATTIYGYVGNGTYPISYSVNTAGLPLTSRGTLMLRAIRG